MINEMRKLFSYQNNCLNQTGIDRAVHLRIACSVEITHAEMENCLAENVGRLGYEDL